MTPGDDTVLGGASQGFPATHWSVVAGAADRAGPEGRARLEALAALYWKPIYRHIRLSWNLGNEEAKDLTQQFFLHILEGTFLDQVSPAKGRFRAFVKASLENFLRQHRRDARRLKRGGGAAPLSIDMSGEEPFEVPAPPSAPGEAMDREWRRILLAEAVNRLRAAYEREGKGEYFEVFRLLDLESPDGDRPRYHDVAAALKIKETDVDNRLAHARKRLFEIVREIVAESVADEEALGAEMRELFPG